MNISRFFQRISKRYRLRLLSPCRLTRDRLLSEGTWFQIIATGIFCLLATIIVGLFLIPVYGHFCLRNLSSPNYGAIPFHPSNVFDAAYFLLFNNGGQNLFDGWNIGGVVITSIGIVLIAVLTSAFTSRYQRRVQRYIDGESRYRLKDHIVIFGVSDYLYSIISEKTKNDSSQVFLIVTTQNVASVRREVLSFINAGLKKKNFVFYFGDRTSFEDISTLSLEYAREVYVIGDRQESDDIESYRDANNMDCVEIIGRYLKDHRKAKTITLERIEKDGHLAQIEKVNRPVVYSNDSPLPCHVMFEYQTTFAAFQFCEIPSDIKEHLVFMPFNYYDLWARKVLVTGKAGVFEYNPLDTIVDPEGKKSYITEKSEETVHLVILGMTKMGIAMALQAAQVCHYPNFKSDGILGTNQRKRTRITFIDSDADIERNYFKGRFPSLMADTRTRFLDFSQSADYDAWVSDKDILWTGDEQGWYDVEWEFIKGRIESNPVQTFLEAASADKRHIVTIAVCLPKSHQSIATAMYLPSSVYGDCLQILTYQRRSGTIIHSLAKTDVPPGESARYKNIIPFGMMEDGYDSSLDGDTRAMLVSYIYDSYYEPRPVIQTTIEDGEEKLILGVEPCHSSDVRLERFDTEYLDWPPKGLHTEEEHVIYRAYPHYRENWSEKYVTEKLSSTFNANSITTKLRGIGYTESNCPKKFSDEELATLIRVEHNRWNIEKLLTGFRALSESEAIEMASLRDPCHGLWKEKRKKHKGWPDRAHIDICSVEELHRREDQEIIDFDKYLSEAIPYILEKERDYRT